MNPQIFREYDATGEFKQGGLRDFFLYRDLPSFEEYVLVSQVAYQVEVYRRTPEGSWLLSRYEGPEASFPISALNITLPLAEIYAGVL